MEYTILQNQAECRQCGDKPYSAHRHDYKECKCGAIAVDGGNDYLRRSAKNLDDVIEMSITLPRRVAVDVCLELGEAIKTGRNEFGVLCAVARSLRDSGFQISEK